MSIGEISGPGRAAPLREPADRPEESQELRQRLEQALKKTEDRGGPGREPSGSGRQPTAEEGEAGVLSGAAILRGLQGSLAGAAEARPGPEDLEGRLQALTEIADRLLVSESGSSDKEIRILIKESLLPGAEIRLTLQDGSVGVNFVCANEQSALFLERHRAELERRLETRLGGPAQVQVQRQSPEGGEGRSRGRRDLYAEWAREKG